MLLVAIKHCLPAKSENSIRKGHAENRIKELKEDFRVQGFTSYESMIESS
jgi:hypothetical protein